MTTRRRPHTTANLPAARRRDISGAVIAVIGFTFVALGIWAATDPESFSKTIANFGEFNSHLIHDYAVCSIVFGTGLLLGWRVPSWRAPTLILAAIWNGLHGFFHIVDMSMANTKYLGPAEAILLCLTSATLAALAFSEWRHPRSAEIQERGRTGE